jgi:AGZA family xanthine/uracil permease-like MFS transporter
MVIWIGIVITAQAFQATPREHAPAVVVGLLPAVAAWGTFMAKKGVAALAEVSHWNLNLQQQATQLDEAFQKVGGIWIVGGFALEQGFIFTSMILAAVTVAIIERDFVRAALWCTIAAALSVAGLMHSFRYGEQDTEVVLAPAWTHVLGYFIMGLCFFLARWLTVPDKGHH